MPTADDIKDERDLKLKRISEHSSAIREVTSHRYSLFTTISTLAAALLIVSNFGLGLLNLTDFSQRLILSILLSIVPIGCWGLLLQTDLDYKQIWGLIYKIAGEPKSDIKHNSYEIFLAYIPIYLLTFLTLIIILIIINLWI